MDKFKIGQLTKELVAIQLKKMGDPCAAAACKGGMTGLLLADQNMPKGAVLILEAVAETAQETHFLRVGQLDEIRRAIEAHFMGAGEAFGALLCEQPDYETQARGLKE